MYLQKLNYFAQYPVPSTHLFRKILFVTLLYFCCNMMTAQIYSGCVTDACTGKAIPGATINLSCTSGCQVGQGTNITTQTNSEGCWQASVWSVQGAATWVITLGLPDGVTSPGHYFIQDNNQNVSGLNFELLLEEWEITVNGASMPFFNNPSSPYPVCLNETVCFGLSEQYVANWFSSNEGCYDFHYKVFITDGSGQPIKFVSDGCINLNRRPNIGTDGCNGYNKNLKSVLQSSEISVPLGSTLLIQMDHFCCTKNCKPGEGSLVNTQAIFIKLQSIEQIDVDFQFITNSSNDAASNNGDNPSDGLEPISNVTPGPALSDITCGIDANIVQNTGSPLDYVNYIVSEVDCSDGEDPLVIFEQTVPLNGTGQPENYFFADDFRFDTGFPPPFDNIPWFAWDANTANKCFNVVVEVGNECGTASAESFFTIGEVCNFCMIGINNPGLQNEYAQQFELTKAALTSTDSKVTVYPNPVQQELTFELKNIKQATIRIMNIAGQEVDVFSIRNNQQYDTSNLPEGTYFYEWQEGTKKGIEKLIKL